MMIFLVIIEQNSFSLNSILTFQKIKTQTCYIWLLKFGEISQYFSKIVACPNWCTGLLRFTSSLYFIHKADELHGMKLENSCVWTVATFYPNNVANQSSKYFLSHILTSSAEKGSISFTAADRAEICIGHFVYNTSHFLSHLSSQPSGWTHSIVLLMLSRWKKLSPALSSCVIIWVSLERSGCGSVCRSWCLHVCLWVGADPSASVELTGMAAGRADTNLMCQVEGTAWVCHHFHK